MRNSEPVENMENGGKHIVIIEDDATLLHLITKSLISKGYRVTGIPAFPTMELLFDLKADCFLLDENLPNISGHIICILLKEKQKTKDTPIILMSAFDELAYFADLCRADAYLKKPFNSHELICILTSLFSGVPASFSY
jgi:DNA-binding response OmpR family regulator